MAYIITDECISCDACVVECKNEAIREEETIYVIDPDKCTECIGFFATAKCAEICPVDQCCIPDPAHAETREQLLEKWKKLYPGQTPAST